MICATIFYLFYQMIVIFFVPICWAAVFAIVFFPLYKRILKRVKTRGLAATITCVLIIVLIIGPITYLFVALVLEANDAVVSVKEMYDSGKLDNMLAFDLPWFESMKEKLSQYYDVSKIKLDELARDTIRRISGVVLNQTRWVVTNGTKAVFFFALMIFTMYYFFKDGEAIMGKIRRLMPLNPEQINAALSQLHDVIQATMYGGVLIALLQGFLGGVMFWIAGISSPVFWGALMAFLSIIPVVGAFLVYVPAGIILILGGSPGWGIFIILFGSLGISQVDNILRPLLISGRTAMHPLLLFFTILGGISLFGLLGVVVGPIIAAAFTIMLRIFEMRLHPEDSDPPAEATASG